MTDATSPRRYGSLAFGVALALLLVASAVALGGSAAAQDGAGAPTEPFVVALEDDGSARVTLTVTFDLTTDAERRAFERLRNNDTARRAFRDGYADGLRAVAATAENRTGREMSVTDPAAELRRANDTGVVALSVTWSGLARVEGDRLVVREPFASDYQPDRRFVVRAPDGHELSSVSPEPDARDGSTARWDAGTSLDGFRVVAAPAEEPTEPADGTTGAGDATGGTTTGQPGFGPVTLLLACALVGLAVERRRR